MFFVYIIKNPDNKLYIGISENPEQRLKNHNSNQGAQFTKHKTVFQIVFLEKYNDLSQARKREIQIKRWRREKKEFLIERYNQGLETRI